MSVLLLVTACGAGESPGPGGEPAVAPRSTSVPTPTATPTATPTPVTPPAPAGPPEVRLVAAGGSHSCVLLGDETVRCWGSNADGQLGVTSVKESARPIVVPGLRGVAELALGDDFSCARLGDRTVSCWGSDSFGQLAGGTSTGNSRATPVLVPGLADVAFIRAGDWHAAAVSAVGEVKFWGRNNVGQYGDGAEVDLATPTVNPAILQPPALALGGFHGCAIVSGGRTVKCWGWNEFGQLGDGSSGKLAVKRAPVAVAKLDEVKDLALGENHSCALLVSGEVRCWGSDEYGQLGDGGRRDSARPVAVKGLAGVSELVAGGYHTCARLEDGGLRCWGSNAAGQLGDGSRTDRRVPTAVVDVGPARQLAAGREHSCALLVDGGLWCWGQQGGAALGTAGDAPRPVRVTL